MTSAQKPLQSVVVVAQECPRSAFIPVRSARKTPRPTPHSEDHFDGLLLRGSYSSVGQKHTIDMLYRYFQRTLPLKTARNNTLREKKFFSFLFYFKPGTNLQEQMQKIRQILIRYDIFCD